MRTISILHSVLLWVGLAWLSAGCARGPSTPRPQPLDRELVYRDPTHQFQAYNGMNVVLLPDASTNLVTVDMRFAVGATADPPGKAGLAHLVEHLRFFMSAFGDKYPPVNALLAEHALSFNAATTWDATHYTATGPRASLAPLVALELGRLTADCGGIAPELLEREREVVRNELRQRFGDESLAFHRFLLAAIYPQDHPYSRPIGGNDQELASITMDDVCRFLADHYGPSNATLIIIGNTTKDEVTELLTKVLPAVPPRPTVELPPVPSTRVDSATLSYRLDVDEPLVMAAVPMAGRFHDSGPAAAYLLERVGVALELLAASQPHITDTGIEQTGGEYAPMGLIWVAVKHPEHFAQARALIHQAIDTVMAEARSPAVHESFAVYRQLQLGRLFGKLERLSSLGTLLGDSMQFAPGAQLVVSEIDRMDRITGLEVRRTAAAMFVATKIIQVSPPEPGADQDRAGARVARSQLVLSPSAHDEATGRPTALDTSEAHKPLDVDAPPGAVSKTRAFTLANGLRVFLFSTTRQPVVDIRLVVGTGSAADPVDRAGLARLTARLLTPNAVFRYDRDGALALINFSRTGGRYGRDVEPYATTFTVRGMSNYTDVYLHALHHMVISASYGDEAVAQTRAEQRQELASPDQRRRVRQLVALRSAVFGADHPFARDAVDSLGTLERIDAAALRQFKRQHYRPDNATLIVVGQFDAALVEQHVRYHFGSWAGTGTRAAAAPAPAAGAHAAADASADSSHAAATAPAAGAHAAQRAEPVFLGIADDERTQVTITLAFPTAGSAAETRAAREVVDRMLDSRVQSVRSRLGASYGMKVERQEVVGAGMLVIEGSVDRERAGEALTEVRQRLDGLRAGDGLAEDFVVARRKAVEHLLADTTDSMSIADQLAFLAKHGMPLGFYDTLVRQVAALTLQAAQAQLAQDLAPARETVIVSGPRAAIERAFAEAGIARPQITQ